MEQTITSTQNPQVKALVRLRDSRAQRREQGLFLAEGVKLAEEAMASGLVAEELFYTRAAAEKHPQAVAELAAYGAKTTCITPEVAAKISYTQTPQGVFLLCRMLDNHLDLGKIKGSGRYLLANSLQDPGNLGTIIRSAAAFEADGLILSEDCVDVYSPKVLRGAMGGAFRLPIFVVPSMAEAVGALRAQGLRVYAAALSDTATPLHRADLGPGCGVLVGNEGSGLPQELIDGCTGSVIIPMGPGAESLNAGVAAGILLWELYKSRLG